MFLIISNCFPTIFNLNFQHDSFNRNASNQEHTQYLPQYTLNCTQKSTQHLTFPMILYHCTQKSTQHLTFPSIL